MTMIPSLYIHMPFCRRKCLYCDFYSIVGNDLVSGYVDTIIRQVNALDTRFDTIFVGGGTPTALDRVTLGRLLASLKARALPQAEFTVEANPESLDSDKIKLMLQSGVNRISIGVQSLDDRILKRLGRLHGAAMAVEAVRLASKNGFSNISADLIFGVWGQKTEDWHAMLEEASRLPLTHVSAYALTYEESTPLFAAIKNKSVKPLEEGVVADMYEMAIDTLALRLFKQYEVSSFAKGLFRCRHNMNYWDNGQYIGIGASAASYVNGERSKNVSDVAEYMRRERANEPLEESRECLEPVRRAKETAAIKIRTKDGIDFAWFREKTGFDFMDLERKAVEDLLGKELIKYKRDKDVCVGICLKRKGFLFCDTVSSALL